MFVRKRSWSLAFVLVVALLVPGGCAFFLRDPQVGVPVAPSPVVEAQPSVAA